MAKVAERMLTVGQVADRLGVANSSVRIWAKKGRFPGAEYHTTPAGSYWLIPRAAVDGFQRRSVGRPRKAGSKKGGQRASKKRKEEMGR
jgi:excisionase family DNA binding protein